MLYDVEMTLGKRIKAARERLKPTVTQGALGAKLGVTDKAVSGWERNIDRPDLDKIADLATILEVPVRWLLKGRGAPPAPDTLDSVSDQLDEHERAVLAAIAETLLKQRSTAA